jgi:hypothetical protein
MNVTPETESEGPLTIRKVGPNGPIIIKWPDPCGILELNPNLSNPARWAPAPVQTSPYEFWPTNDAEVYFRLRR